MVRGRRDRALPAGHRRTRARPSAARRSRSASCRAHRRARKARARRPRRPRRAQRLLQFAAERRGRRQAGEARQDGAAHAALPTARRRCDHRRARPSRAWCRLTLPAADELRLWENIDPLEVRRRRPAARARRHEPERATHHLAAPAPVRRHAGAHALGRHQRGARLAARARLERELCRRVKGNSRTRPSWKN